MINYEYRGRCLLNEISEIQCIGICESMNLSSCSCTIDNECMICCQSNGGSCNPLEDVTLSNGVLCSRGICRNVSPLVSKCACVEVWM